MTLPNHRSLSEKAQRIYASQDFARNAGALPLQVARACYREPRTCFSFPQAKTRIFEVAIFHFSIRPIRRAKGHSAVAQIAYDTRCKLTNERTTENLDCSGHKQDVIQWQVIGQKMKPGELAARAERAEKRWDARVAGRWMSLCRVR